MSFASVFDYGFFGAFACFFCADKGDFGIESISFGVRISEIYGRASVFRMFRVVAESSVYVADCYGSWVELFCDFAGNRCSMSVRSYFGYSS